MTKTKVRQSPSSGFPYLLGGLQVVVKAAEKFETEGLAREIYHHRRLRHPHITRLYEVIHTENNVWLVLEYCHGKLALRCRPNSLGNRRRII